MKATAVGELFLVVGLLLLAWMVWAQQEELNRLAIVIGDLEARTQPKPRPRPKPKPKAEEPAG